jgi:predicted signal transduction protein with EAL and GGDEF domain
VGALVALVGPAMTRTWAPHRRAYYPRLWTSAVIVAPLAGVLAYLTTPPLWVLITVPALLGVAASQLQWWLWRRRHPVVDLEVLARETARWN